VTPKKTIPKLSESVKDETDDKAAALEEVDFFGPCTAMRKAAQQKIQPSEAVPAKVTLETPSKVSQPIPSENKPEPKVIVRSELETVLEPEEKNETMDLREPEEKNETMDLREPEEKNETIDEDFLSSPKSEDGQSVPLAEKKPDETSDKGSSPPKEAAESKKSVESAEAVSIVEPSENKKAVQVESDKGDMTLNVSKTDKMTLVPAEAEVVAEVKPSANSESVEVVLDEGKVNLEKTEAVSEKVDVEMAFEEVEVEAAPSEPEERDKTQVGETSATGLSMNVDAVPEISEVDAVLVEPEHVESKSVPEKTTESTSEVEERKAQPSDKKASPANIMAVFDELLGHAPTSKPLPLPALEPDGLLDAAEVEIPMQACDSMIALRANEEPVDNDATQILSLSAIVTDVSAEVVDDEATDEEEPQNVNFVPVESSEQIPKIVDNEETQNLSIIVSTNASGPNQNIIDDEATQELNLLSCVGPQVEKVESVKSPSKSRKVPSQDDDWNVKNITEFKSHKNLKSAGGLSRSVQSVNKKKLDSPNKMRVKRKRSKEEIDPSKIVVKKLKSGPIEKFVTTTKKKGTAVLKRRRKREIKKGLRPKYTQQVFMTSNQLVINCKRKIGCSTILSKPVCLVESKRKRRRTKGSNLSLNDKCEKSMLDTSINADTTMLLDTTTIAGEDLDVTSIGVDKNTSMMDESRFSVKKPPIFEPVVNPWYNNPEKNLPRRRRRKSMGRNEPFIVGESQPLMDGLDNFSVLHDQSILDLNFCK